MTLQQIRLGCLHCDRDDGDYIDAIPKEWHLVKQVHKVLDPGGLHDADPAVLDWQTHLGICPDCWIEQDYADLQYLPLAIQNDEFRKTICRGLPSLKYPGQLVMTAGVASLGEQLPRVLERVGSFMSFTADNDAHGEHDFGIFDDGEERIFWKIDYYDKDLKFGSAEPSEPELTIRVLTVMLAEEY